MTRALAVLAVLLVIFGDQCRLCGAQRDLISGDGPTVCRTCVRGAVTRVDILEADHRNREGQWP